MDAASKVRGEDWANTKAGNNAAKLARIMVVV
jgi:hypothetical protein